MQKRFTTEKRMWHNCLMNILKLVSELQTICPSTTVNMHHYAWQREAGHFLTFFTCESPWKQMQLTWSGFSRISARCDWKIINRTSVCGSELVFSILCPYRPSLSLRILSPNFITSCSATFTLSHPVRPHSCRPVETWEKLPAVDEANQESLWLLQGRWENSQPPTNTQHKQDLVFSSSFPHLNFCRLLNVVANVFQNTEVI